MREIFLGDLYLVRGGSVDPSKYPDETFEYYSIPAYDTGIPEVTSGASIGSSKKLFEPNDVLLSRIVPHIRRCWIVGKESGYRQIGSGEWITFRSKEVQPSYLRFYLMSDDFNSKFMKTIKGVGGSLMRADPKQVAKFKFLLPPLPLQKKIAAILDEADSYKHKTKAIIDKYDELTQSLFLDMFGDPVTNPKGWEKKPLSEVCSKITDGEHGTVKRVKEGRLYLMARNVGHHSIQLDEVSFITEQDHERIYKRCNPEPGDLLLVCVGATIGRCCLVPNNPDQFSLARSVALIKPLKLLNSKYLLYHFKDDNFQNEIMNSRNTSAQAGLYTGQIKKLGMSLPPIDQQEVFAERVQQIESQKAQAQLSLEKAEELFNSLLQKAFIGELKS